jgi:serine/threonine-protein kinase
MADELARLQETLSGQGVASDADGQRTLGRTAQASGRLPDDRDRSLFPSTRIGVDAENDFRLRAEIGRGGMASVWAAEQMALAREVALKRCTERSPEAEHLLLREAIITGQLEHPGIVPVHTVLMDSEGPVVVMKRVSGTTWDALIRAAETPLEQHLDILAAALNAVELAHSRGVVHRDLKPSNIMIGDYGQVYVLDWGVAMRRQDAPSDAIVGTPFYMAPEMAEGRADERTDVFLLGATLHEVLTGSPRHRGDTALLLLYAAMYVEPYAYGKDVPEELAQLCNRACARRPEDRFQSVAELRHALRTYRTHRNAQLLCDAADQAQKRALANAADTARYAHAQSDFLEARFGYHAALRIWAESPRATQGLRSTLQAMCRRELDAGRSEPARALLAELNPPDLELAARANTLEEAQRRARERMARIERDQDPAVGARTRAQSYLLLGAATALMTLVLYVQRVLFPHFAPSALRLTIVGGAVLALLLLLVLRWRRTGEFNSINRRIAEITISTLAVSFASRLSGYMLSTEPSHILVTDAFILGLGGGLLSAYHRAGPWLASMSFAAAVVGSIWPQWIDELFIALSIFVPTALLAWRRVAHTHAPAAAPSAKSEAGDSAMPSQSAPS